MLNVGKIEEGFVLDHIQAGMSLQIYHDLKLDKLDCTVAIIKNALSGITEVPSELVPATSLIREFISGGIYEDLY